MRVLVVFCHKNMRARWAAEALLPYLRERSVGCEVIDLDEIPACSEVLEGNKRLLLDGRLSGPFCLMVVLGGDGSILRASRLAVLLGLPILGMNYGHLGFLSNPEGVSWQELIQSALEGECQTELLPTLEIELHSGLRNGLAAARPQRMFALNDVAVNRAASTNVMEYAIRVSGCELATMRGDGVVVASSTGSTAYALSAGGPLLAPGNRGLVIVPLAPHTLSSRAVVTGQDDCVEIDLDPFGEGAGEGLSIQVDGELLSLERPADKLYVRGGPASVELLRIEGESFYKRASAVFFKQ